MIDQQTIELLMKGLTHITWRSMVMIGVSFVLFEDYLHDSFGLFPQYYLAFLKLLKKFGCLGDYNTRLLAP